MSTPSIEDVLEEHQPVFESDGDYGEMQWVECSCGDEYFVDTDADEATHRAHVADRLRAAGVTREEAQAEECQTCGGGGVIPEPDDPNYPEAGVHPIHCPDCDGRPREARAEGGLAKAVLHKHGEDGCRWVGIRNLTTGEGDGHYECPFGDPEALARAVLAAVPEEVRPENEVKAEALMEAADGLDAHSESEGGLLAGDCTEWLRDRADRLSRADGEAGS